MNAPGILNEVYFINFHQAQLKWVSAEEKWNFTHQIWVEGYPLKKKIRNIFLKFQQVFFFRELSKMFEEISHFVTF